MHELSITRNIVEAVAEHARGRTVDAVTLKIGSLSGVEIDALRFCFDICTDGTSLAGAKLLIEEVEGRGHCMTCDAPVKLESPIPICPCEKRSRVIIEAGEELLIHSMEVR